MSGIENLNFVSMKTKKWVSLFFLIFVSGFLSAGMTEKADNKQNRNVKDFDAVNVSAGIELILAMGDREAVRIEADDSIIEEIITEVKGSTLHIYRKSGSWFNIFNWRRSRPVKAYVTAINLRKIDASSGSDVKSENSIKGDRLEVRASSGSSVAMNVVYKNIFLSCSSGADIRMSGKAKTVEADASSGSDINARELEAVICRASASSGADIAVYATGEIHAKSSSGADIRYYGNPEIKNIEESSGGDVTQR
jgi:hypothetical protein